MLHLTTEEAAAVERRVAGIEARTGVQVVAAVVARSDHYPEIPWSAFALGASLAALATALSDLMRPSWITAATAVGHGVAVLGAGAALALATVLAPAFARLFLRSTRAEGEVRQRAEGMFLESEVFRTPARTGVLLLASLFERRVEVLPDVGLAGRIGPDGWRAVIDCMGGSLAAGRTAEALEAGLAALEEVLIGAGLKARGGDRGGSLPDRPVEGRDP